MTKMLQLGDVTSCQFFLSWLYVIKAVVVSNSLLAYNIVFFKRIFSFTFSKTFLSNVTRGLSTSILYVKSEFHMVDLFTGLE